MAFVHLLGTGAGASSPERTTTMLAFESGGRALVVDCGGDVVQRLLQAGIGADDLDAMIVTHEHPDHVAGFPLFMEKIWLLGRRRPIAVHGIAPALAQARRLWEAFPSAAAWEGVPEIQWREVALEEGAPVLEDDRWRVHASPGTHGVPVIGLRVEDLRGGGVCAYSCDTAKSAAITALARGAEVLVHEATGTPQGGHTTYREAAEVARDAGARRLVLVHLPPDASEDALREAREIFPETTFGVDGGHHAF